ncbi:BnaC08g20130D [Brassica napus]|uniref:BnaC08g20130D protein n=1 Tax=Brassica napus TaxID=3708 RepID=A0A078HN85_BRANA|nr:BnaC08g20130D [Brassica napus]
MHDRYSQLSRKFAEVEGERQKLMMTLKNVRASRKAMLLNFHHHLAAYKFSRVSADTPTNIDPTLSAVPKSLLEMTFQTTMSDLLDNDDEEPWISGTSALDSVAVRLGSLVAPLHSLFTIDLASPTADQDLAFSGKLTKLGCAPLGVAAGGCVRVILSAVGCFVLIMVQKGSVVSAGSALNHSVAKLSSSCSGCNDLSSLMCKVDVSAFMPYPRDVWIVKRSFWSGCEVLVLSCEWGWYRLAGHRQQR